VSVNEGPSFGIPVAIFQARVSESVDLFRTSYMPDRDGGRFLLNVQSKPNSSVAITLLLNWKAALQK
jgi:hypothetical protein